MPSNTIMDLSKKSASYEENKYFLSRAFKSKEEFVDEYKNLYSKKSKAVDLYLLVLCELEEAVSTGNVENLKKFDKIFDYICEAEDQETLKTYYVNNPIKSINLVVSSCKHNQLNILEYLFSSKSKILGNLFSETAILPDDEDDACHNAFYYAIRSGNVVLLETLINKWPNNYLTEHPSELDEILAHAYEELKLIHVPLSEEIEIFVESKLINLRFFSNASDDQNATSYSHNIKERIELVLQNINLLTTEYSNNEKVDEKFLFVAKFIAQNIHILKRQLKATYDRLPWEEIEFCLICFISSRIKRQEINLFYNTRLNKTKIIQQLEHFAKKLTEEKCNIERMAAGKLSTDYPKMKREQFIAKIINDNPAFSELYSDYQHIRDVHSLEKMNDYLKLALSADPKQREGQLIITRVLQIIGEYLKNTIESPKLSNSASELLLLSLPKNTREVIIDLRNSLSHANSLSKRTEIEEKTVNFFIGVQNDTKKIDEVITSILYNKKIKTLRTLLLKISNSEKVEDMEEVREAFTNANVEDVTSESFATVEHGVLEKLIAELNEQVTEKTTNEVELFYKINGIINSASTRTKNIREDYSTGYLLLKALCYGFGDNKVDENLIRAMKFYANKILETIPLQIEPQNLKEIADLVRKISQSFKMRKQDVNIEKVNRLACEIFYIAELETGDLKWIEELRDKLNDRGTFIPAYKQKKTASFTEEEYKLQLEQKLLELKRILKNNSLNGKVSEKLPVYKKDKKLQAVVEMLVLDIMSILGQSEKHLENNLLFLDDNIPLLTGKCLRNHLAHDNTLVEVLLADASIAVFLNARKLTTENVIKSKRKIGKLVSDDPCKLKDKYNENLNRIVNQEKMFRAAQAGNLEDFKSYLSKGADITAKTISLSSVLHHAAKADNLDLIKFIVGHNLDCNAKDVNGQSALHVAAAYAKKNIKYIVKTFESHVNDVDNHGKSPLHVAAQNGNKDATEILLKTNASTNVKDKAGCSPLHYAIRNNHMDVFKLLLECEGNIDNNEISGGLTPLYVAAESGYVEFVKYLLNNGANVEARNDTAGTPLHIAALNGHVDAANALITKGADVNSRALDGCTPLHYAAENGHEKIVDNLLNHGAVADVVDKTFNYTPLHHAARDGNENILKSLLAHNASALVATVKGLTPLHYAAEYGRVKTTAILIEHGVGVNVKDKQLATPLYYAADNGHYAVAEILIKNGANVNSSNIIKMTPLHNAALKGHEKLTQLLLEHKAKVNARDVKGNTALHAAAINGNLDNLRLLLQNSANVNVKSYDGMTPLHEAAIVGKANAAALLIQNNANVNAKGKYELTPLHVTIVGGYVDVVKVLIENKAYVNARAIERHTPLHAAVELGNAEIVEILVKNGADVHAMANKTTPLTIASQLNHGEIVEMLLENGADVDEDGGEPISIAALAGSKDAIEVLLKYNACVTYKGTENETILHIAASRGNKDIVRAIVNKGAYVNTLTYNGMSPMHFAAQNGHEEIVEILIANNGEVNLTSGIGTPLHSAAGHGHVNIVELLLCNGAKVDIIDERGRTPIELAISQGFLHVVKMILKHRNVILPVLRNQGYTMLHLAAQETSLEVVKFLVDIGCDTRARNAYGSKAMHIAAREGFIEAVEYFLTIGLNVNEYGTANQTMLHYAAMKNHLHVAKLLVEKSADVNATDTNGITPLHIAANFGFKDIVEFLLSNGAFYNPISEVNPSPVDMTEDSDIINLLTSTDRLFKSAMRNKHLEVDKSIKKGAFVNAKNLENYTALHYAAWKGYEEVADILLANKANPNIVGKKGYTALHYAVKFSRVNIVKKLLLHGAMYDAPSRTGKTPLALSEDNNISKILRVIDESFKKVKAGNVQVIEDLKNNKDLDTVKAAMNACDRENQTLIVVAVHSKFPKLELLKGVLHSDVSEDVAVAYALLHQGQNENALYILRNAYDRRKEMLGPDNPATLEIQTHVAKALYKQGMYQQALSMLEEISEKQTKMLGSNDKDTLNTRSMMALVLHRQGKDDEAYEIYQDVYQRQIQILDPDHVDILQTRFHTAMVLDRQEKYDEALAIYRDVYEKRKASLGSNDIATICAKNNIAMVLSNQGKFDESMKLHKEVLEAKKSLLGINNADTLRTLHNIAATLSRQNKHTEALKTYQEVLSIQKASLQPNHPETLNTQYSIANLFLTQGKYTSALRVFKECFNQRKAVFGANHPTTVEIAMKMEAIRKIFALQGKTEAEVFQNLQQDILITASKGDVKTVECLLNDGIDVNSKDLEGRTSLHYAINNGHIAVVKTLIKYHANVCEATNKGNTPLHTATTKGNKEIVDLLLAYVNREKLHDFINAKTTTAGTTALHVAAKAGSLELVKALLRNGAIYEIKNNDGKKPVNLSKNQDVIKFLEFVHTIFSAVNSPVSTNCLERLDATTTDVFLALANTRDAHGKTLLQVAIAKKQKDIASKLLERLKLCDLD